MKKNLTLTPFVKSHIRWAILIFATVGSLGWWYYDHRFPSWDEEVMLSDGRTLIVHRKQEFVEGYGVRRTWLTFSLPEMGGKRTWTQWMYPAIVDVMDGKVYMVGYTPGVKQFSIYVNPRYLLVAYQWDGKDFVRIPFLNVPEKIRQKWNVLPCSKRGENTSWQAKTHGWCSDLGAYVAGETRLMNLTKMQAGSKFLADLGNNSIFSE